MEERSIVADRPIENRDDDALGYWPFAESLAAGLVNRASDQGFVVGVQAKWGMGKTSAVNLMVAAITEIESPLRKDERTRFQIFNPWQFASTEGLARSYLSVLGRMIADSIGEDVFDKKKGIFKSIVSKGNGLIGHATAAGIVAASGGAALPFMSAIQGGVAGALNLSGEMASAQELDDLARNVRQSLTRLPHRIILILDDIDRLTPDELSTIFTLVKTFGDLPNVIHVLIYDREIVDETLGSYFQGSRNPSYLQKIVQAEFDLPRPTNIGLLNLLNNTIGPIFKDVRQSNALNDVWRVSFRDYIKSPRDIIKTRNALSVTWPSIKEEVYPPDLIAIEVFRLFDRPLHQLILENRQLLVGNEIDYSGDRKRKLSDEIKSGRSNQLCHLISAMFPLLEKNLGSPSASRPRSISEGRPIGSDSGFDAYFRMSIGSGSISVSLVEDLSQNLSNADAVDTHFRAAAGVEDESYMPAFFDEFINVLEDSEEELAFGTLEGFARGGGMALQERFVGRKRVLFFDNFQRMSVATKKILERINRDGLYGNLLRLFENPESDLNVDVFVLAKVAERRALIYSDEKDGLELGLSDEEIDSLAHAVALRANEKLRSGEIFSSPVLWMLLRLLAKSKYVDGLCERLIDAAHEPEAGRKIALSAMNIQMEGEYGVESRMDRMPPEAIYDLSKLVPLIEGQLKEEEIDDLTRRNLENFVRSGQILLEGGTPERF